jgi:membrane protease YdiL (CAAX protease family)
MGRFFFHTSLTISEGFNRCKEILLTFSIFFLPGILFPPLIRGSEFNDPAFLAASILIALPQIGVILYLIDTIGNRSRDTYGIVPVKISDVAKGVLFFLGIIPLLLAILFITSALPAGWIVSALPSFRWRYTNYSILPLTAAVCVLGGYREELYFRAYLLTEFRNMGASFPAAAAVGTLLFGIGHLYQGYTGFFMALILGTYLALVFRRCRNLHVPAIAHGLYNFAVLLLSGFL